MVDVGGIQKPQSSLTDMRSSKANVNAFSSRAILRVVIFFSRKTSRTFWKSRRRTHTHYQRRIKRGGGRGCSPSWVHSSDRPTGISELKFTKFSYLKFFAYCMLFRSAGECTKIGTSRPKTFFLNFLGGVLPPPVGEGTSPHHTSPHTFAPF